MKIIYIFIGVLFLSLVSGCQTIDNKSQSAIKKENEKLSKFIQQPVSELKIVMGEPDEVVYDNKGSKFFIYKKKKYNITCERKFEIDQNMNFQVLPYFLLVLIYGSNLNKCFNGSHKKINVTYCE